MPLYTVENLPQRAQVMTTFQNGNPLKIQLPFHCTFRHKESQLENGL